MEPQAIAALSRFDPAMWRFHIRRFDGRWLARPAPQPDASPGNAETWTRVLSDTWAFDTAREASDAAVAHGVDATEFAVIPAPRDPGAWLEEGLPRSR